MEPDFGASLIPVKGEALEHGDIVYEVVRHGQSGSDVKYKKLRVIRSEGGTVTVTDASGTKPGSHPHRKIRQESLRMEKPSVKTLQKQTPASVLASKPEPQAKRSAIGDDQFEAWLEMGRGLVGDVDAEIAQLESQKTEITDALATIDANHRRTIEALEDELVSAKKAHENDRALASSRLDSIDGKLARALERRAGLEAMLGKGR